MAKCIMCQRPVVSDPHILSNGELVHDGCRYAVFTPRVRPKLIGGGRSDLVRERAARK